MDTDQIMRFVMAASELESAVRSADQRARKSRAGKDPTEAEAYFSRAAVQLRNALGNLRTAAACSEE